MSKIIQSGEFLPALLGKFAGLLMKVVVSLAKNVLSPLATMTWLGTSGVAVLGNMLTGKGVMKVGRRYHNIVHMD